jgi:adenine phosphoribosyltransferase
MYDFKSKIRSIPGFPIKGITFRDITSLMKDAEAFHNACEDLVSRYKGQKIDKIIGIDARGFVFGAVLAYQLGVGFVPVRKKGKLPYKTISEKYTLEYGTAEVEIHKDDIVKGDRVVIVDDLIATGGTVSAAIKLVERLEGKIIECAFVVELRDLKGREMIKGYNVYSLVSFEGR